MIVVAITLATTLTATLGLVTWLVYRAISGTEKQADARVAQVDTEGHLERAQFELEQATLALTATKRRAAKLEELLSHALESPAAVAAAPDDWRARMRAIAQEWSAAEDSRDPVPAATDNAVPDKTAAKPAGAATGVLVDSWTADVP